MNSNSVESIREGVAAGLVGWSGPLVMAFVRFPLIVLGLGIAFLIYALSGEREPFLASLLTASLVTVIVNLVSLVLLRWLTRREGIRWATSSGSIARGSGATWAGALPYWCC